MTSRAVAILVLALVLSACGGNQATSDLPASSPEGTPPADCVNPPPDVTTLVEQHDPLACYGGAALTFDTTVMGLGVVDCPGGLESAWLSCGALVGLYPIPETSRPWGVILAARSQDFGEPLYAVFHPDIEGLRARVLDVLVTVTGHYDDPAARSCHNTSWPPGGDPPPVEDVIHACRSTFVITAVDQYEPATDSGPPTPTPEAPSAFGLGGIVQAVDTDIVVRSAPGTGTDSEIYPDSISPPTLAYVFAGPVPMDGYDWYQVVPADLGYLPSPYELGWIAAASREGAPWIAPAAPECPEPTLERIVELSATARLACFADEPLTLDGNLGACSTTAGTEGSGAATLVLPWSTGCHLQTFACCPDVVPYAGGMTIFAAGDLHVPTDTEGQAVRVTGHFDEEASASCEVSGDSWMDSRLRSAGWRPPPGWGEFLCRTEFVVTSVELLPSS